MVMRGAENRVKINYALIRVEVYIIIAPYKIVLIQVSCLCPDVLVERQIAFKKMTEDLDFIGKIFRNYFTVTNWLSDFNIEQGLKKRSAGI
jgi:hypothetical protein